MSPLWNILFLLAFSRSAVVSKLCADEKLDIADLQTYSPRASTITIRQVCIAECLGVTETSRQTTDCLYNSTTGKSKGCTKYFTEEKRNSKRMIFCENGFPLDADVTNWRACDVMYFDLFVYQKSTDTIETKANINENIPFINAARSMNIKVIARLNNFNPGHQFLKLFQNDATRNEFVETVVDAVEQLQLEGLYFFWEWPGCSPLGTSNNCIKGPTVKRSIVAVILSLAKPMKDNDKLFAFMVSGSFSVLTEYGDYFTEISPFVDYFMLETSKMAGYWLTNSDLNFNLKLAKGGVRFLSGMVKDPSFLGKLLVTVDPYALSFEHKDPTAEKISSIIVPNPKEVDKFLNVSNYCKMITSGQYKIVRSPETQNWAAKKEHIFIFDDVDSLKQKIEWLMTFGAGINYVNTFADDAYGTCGCGPLPYLKSLADLLKSKDCEPLPCF